MFKLQQPTRSHLNEEYPQNCIFDTENHIQNYIFTKDNHPLDWKTTSSNHPYKNIVLCLQRPLIFSSGTALSHMKSIYAIVTLEWREMCLWISYNLTRRIHSQKSNSVQNSVSLRSFPSEMMLKARSERKSVCHQHWGKVNVLKIRTVKS